ncbi:MAG: LysE family transporter [Bacteroidia bacterium]|nr:LysE family transporter [Bacteroidia bacterium]
MEIGLPGYFLIAVLATMAGSIPFGPVNLSVVNLTIRKSFRQAMAFSLAASLVEILLALIAIFFGMYFEQFFESNEWIQVLIFVAFIVIGVVYLVRKTHPKLEEKAKFELPDFVKGLVVALINPQVIIFWIFALTFVNQQYKTDFNQINLTVFLAGVFLTKLAVLFSFSKLGNYLKSRLKESCKFINRTMGTVLLVIGVIQAYKYFLL